MAYFSHKAIELIKEFEGLELSAYPDPGTGGEPYTIGYGHTAGVRPWDTTSPAQAEEWLIEDMEWANDAVNDYVRVDIPQSVHDALVSFVFNIGPTAFSESTLVRRLNNGEPIERVVREELPRWDKGGSGPLPGLTRRRAAEIELAVSGLPEPVPGAPERAIDLVDAARYFKGLRHQEEAFDYLQDLLTQAELKEFARRYRNSPDRILDVRYYYQFDSVTTQGNRMCFSSVNGMLVEWEQPGTLSSATGDDEYLERVELYGDTTDATAQVSALRSYGIDCEFVMDGGWDDIEEQIAEGHPVPVGWLHEGALPGSGGGHWSLIVGLEGDNLVVHDPAGEADLVGGGYVSRAMTAGQFIRYSRKNFGKRWMVEGPGSGWMIRVT